MTHWLPVSIFLVTIIPFGLGHTLFGTTAAAYSIMVVGLSFSLFYMIVVLSYLGEEKIVWQRILQPAANLIFHTSEKIFVTTAALLFLGIAFAINYFSNGCISAVQDSAAQLIHARMIAEGNITLPAYQFTDFFNLGAMINDVRYYSQYPPGHILLLALGELLGVSCAVNPLLGAISCGVIFYLAKAVYSQEVARIAALLCLISSPMLQMSSDFWNHATALLCAILFLLSFIKTLQNHSLIWSAGAGFAIAYLAITRPVTALGVALPAILYALYCLYISHRRHALRFLLMIGGASPPLMFLYYFNLQTTGDAFMISYQKLPTSFYGFGYVPVSMLNWTSQTEHTLWHGIGMAFNTLNMLHWNLFFWPTSSLLFVPVIFMFRRAKTHEWLLLATAFSLLIVYIPYYFQSGSRFMYEATGIFNIFTAYGIHRIIAVFYHLRVTNLKRQQIKFRLGFILLCCVVCSIIFTLNVYFNDAGRTEKLLSNHTLTERLREPTILFMPFDKEYFQLAGIYYPVRDDSKIIVAVDKGKKNQKLMALYPHHKAYRARNIGTNNEVWEPLHYSD